MQIEKNTIDTKINLVSDKEWITNNFKTIHSEGIKHAKIVADDYLKKFNKHYPDDVNGEPAYCGFAWVVVFDVKLNTRLGKAMKACGFRKEYGGGISLWNPSYYHGQSMDIKEAGASEYANILKSYGFKAYMSSRAD